MTAYPDSQLVSNHVEGTYEVKEDRMKEYIQEISELKSGLKSFELHQIPHTKNTKADYLT
ncbi:UNVERIFIED_CONTAM: hypothetical protein Sradi_2955400 [Sesamum radiatum]|uniref:RNase H type-1 domain-containing protein n=1 Tax=Sesamum radiatum TaxID=300843 RepID=A0AAW2RZB3_SESRA